MDGDPCRTSFELVDRYGERCPEDGSVVLGLGNQSQLLATGNRQGGAEDSAGVLEHEIDLLGGYLLGGDDDIPFVFPVFVIDDNYHLAL